MANIYRRSGQDNLSLQELDLYHIINDYRAQNGLAPVELSKGLTTTANRHVVDTRENIFPKGELPDDQNLHTWSDAVYRIDPATGRPLAPEAMWEAPQRLRTGYVDTGYEISAAGQATIAEALRGWQQSQSHNEVILNIGPWDGIDFSAMGVGVDTSFAGDPYRGRVFHVWFGDDPDPTGTPRIVGSNGADQIRGTAFADDIVAARGNDAVAGNDGNDVIFGNGGHDRLFGGTGDDRLFGGTGNDELRGGAGRDRLIGSDGADILIGGAGSDMVYSGRGYDRMAGGAGVDAFVFNQRPDMGRGTTRDVIGDFQSGIDRIDLRNLDADLIRGGDQAFDFIGAARFSGTAGELNYRNGVLSADVNGDARVDIQLDIGNDTRITEADFLL